MISLRPYQTESLQALRDYWAAGGGNGLISIPTGGGKSLIIASLIKQLLTDFPRFRIACVTHVRELITQDMIELFRHWPQAPAGVYSAGLNRRDARAQILFCGIQSVWNKTDAIGNVDLLIVDEAHLISRNAESMYGKFIERLRDRTPDMRIVGATASPWRMDSGRLDVGEDKIFDKIVYEANVADLIRDGYLSPLVSKATATRFDISGVGKRGGEYIPSALEIAVDKDFVTKEAVKELVSYGAERKSWLAFCTGVSHATHIRDEIRTHSISCEVVTGETPTGERDRIIGAFKSGRIRCLTSVGVLFTGFNVPQVDLVALLRPTLSAGIYIQSVGRAFRLAPGKSDALILDYAGLVKKFGPVDTVTISKGAKKKTDGDEAVMAKECPNCASLLALATRVCPHCDFEFPQREPDPLPKHDMHADAERPILSSAAPTWLPVSSMRCYRHEKPGSPTSLRVEYFTGLATQRTWKCFEHTGMARAKAATWWRDMRGAMPVPRTVDEALARIDELAEVEAIQVRPAGKYFDVTGTRLKQTEYREAAE